MLLCQLNATKVIRRPPSSTGDVRSTNELSVLGQVTPSLGAYFLMCEWKVAESMREDCYLFLCDVVLNMLTQDRVKQHPGFTHAHLTCSQMERHLPTSEDTLVVIIREGLLALWYTSQAPTPQQRIIIGLKMQVKPPLRNPNLAST